MQVADAVAAPAGGADQRRGHPGDVRRRAASRCRAGPRAARMENTATMIKAALVTTLALLEAEQAGELPAVQGRMRWWVRRWARRWYGRPRSGRKARVGKDAGVSGSSTGLRSDEAAGLPGAMHARLRWPQAGPVPVGCSLAPVPARRARTSPMAGSWVAGSGSGRWAWIW